MEQLTGLDATFLSMENKTTYGHVTALSIYDESEAGEVSIQEMRALVEERLHLIPPMRRRLAPIPLGLDHPFWIEDPDFDLDYHLRHIAVPAPGSNGQLAELAARIAARHLDRAHPLWELYIIEGLEDGGVAVLTKIHHACIDGVAGAEILGLLLDMSPDGTDIAEPETPWRPEREPSPIELMGRGGLGLLGRPRAALRLLRNTVPALPALTRNFNVPLPGLRTRRYPDEPLSAPASAAPPTPFNRAITPHRRFAFGSQSLDEVKAVKTAFDSTVNDVVMTLCAGALRQWLVDHDTLPDDPLLAMVPVSVRDGDGNGEFGNQVSSMVAALPTNVDDPVERLAHMAAEMRVAKEEHEALPAHLLQDFANFTPPSVLGVASRVVNRLADRGTTPFNVVISNVPGPQFPLYSLGAQLRGNYPLSAIAPGVGLNMTVMSYNGNLDWGILADREQIPDVWDLYGHLDTELVTLRKAAA
jgi:WS/DGAT/MGAT family acyltransferase